MFWSRSNGAGEQAKQQHPSLEDAPKCRIVVVGNPGVGKTSFVHLLANGSILLNPRWTCGCYLEVVAHVRENQANVMELWDVGANPKFKKSRRVFYKPLPSSSSPMSLEQPESDIDGIILVHDLSNRKSYANLTGWLREVMREISETNEIVFDHDLLFNGGNNSLPVIVIGTKADLINQDSRVRFSLFAIFSRI
jgi:Rab-like protein 3